MEATMLRSFNNVPIFRRLFIAFALTAIIPGIVIVLLGTNYFNTMLSRGQAVQASFNAQNTAFQQQVNLQRMNAELNTRFAQVFASSGITKSINDPSMAALGAQFNADIAAREVDFDFSLANYEQNFDLATSSNMSGIRSILLSNDPNTTIINEQQADLKAVTGQQGLWNQYRQQQDKVLNLIDQQANPALDYQTAYLALYNANETFLNLRNKWQDVVNVAEVMGTTVTQIGPAQTQPIITSTALAFFFTILVIITTGYLVNVTITQPLRQLAMLTRRIGKGDTSARAPIRGRDEIYMVASSINNMLDSIVRLVQEAQSRHAVLQAQIEKLVSEVSGVGEGDLSIQAEVTTDDLGVLADSFNYMVEELSSLVIRVKSLAHEVENATTLAFERMGQLVRSGDMQIQQISQAAVEVERMANSSRQVAEGAATLYSVALDARKTAQDGRDAVGQALEGITRIHGNVQATAEKVQVLGERSREISNIVEVISSIAHQTNRLALDAAIQAAMAGENGKGFGAVAADIRRLAERSKEQATMITRIVRGVLEDIGAAALSMNDTEKETSQGAELAQQVERALNSLFSAVERQAGEIENINLMATQQLQSSSAVVQIMRAVSQSTEQNSASTHETAQQMERLTQLAEQLLASVGAFKLREEQNPYVAALQGNYAVVPAQNQPGPYDMMTTVTAPSQPLGDGYGNPAGIEPAASFSRYPTTPYPYNGEQGEPQQPRRWNSSPQYDNGNGDWDWRSMLDK
jgi:methyl-accepting chemotaxis protein